MRGSCDGLVGESARTPAYMQRVRRTCIYTWKITGSNKTHPHGKHVARKACRVRFESSARLLRAAVSPLCDCVLIFAALPKQL